MTEDNQVTEFALDEVRYGSSAVSLVYSQKEHARTTFEGGLEMQQSLRLDEVRTSVKGTLVRQYDRGYDQSETTGRTRLTSVQECAGNGECKLPTHFHYPPTETGFEDITTEIVAPLSRLASPLLSDATGDGIPDWLVPDTVGYSTAANPITEWRLAKNTGATFSAEKGVFLQEWPVVADPQGPDDPVQIQPELGAILDYDANGTRDVLLYDVTGTKNNHIVLLSQGDGSFIEINTNIPRPFPSGPAPEGLRSSAGAVHLASIDHDSIADLIQCSDHGDTPETATLSTWKVHLWRPGGFDPDGQVIEALQGYPCALDVFTTDLDADGKMELVLPGMIRVNGVPTERTGTYSAFARNSDGTWTSRYRMLFSAILRDGYGQE